MNIINNIKKILLVASLAIPAGLSADTKEINVKKAIMPALKSGIGYTTLLTLGGILYLIKNNPFPKDEQLPILETQLNMLMTTGVHKLLAQDMIFMVLKLALVNCSVETLVTIYNRLAGTNHEITENDYLVANDIYCLGKILTATESVKFLL